MRLERSARVVSALLTAALLSAGTVFVVIASQAEGSGSEDYPALVLLGDVLLGTVYAGIGGAILIRRPGHRVAWCLLLTGLTFCLSAFLTAYGLHGVSGDQGPSLALGAHALSIGTAIWPLQIGCIFSLLVLFPSGRFPSPAWRSLFKVTLVIVALVFLGAVVVREHADPPHETIANPMHLSDLEWTLPVFILVSVSVMAAFVAAAISTMFRFWRSRGEERAQYKWLALSVAIIVLTIPLSLPENPSAAWKYISTFAALCPPVAIAIAILKYRLYDIDALVNRTLVYGSLTAATVASYLVLVVSLGWVARAVAGQGSNELAIAATTLIVAGLFQPARRRIQGVVDRRFYRSHYDALRVVDAFQTRLRNEVDLELLQRDLVSTVYEALQPASVTVWIGRGRAP